MCVLGGWVLSMLVNYLLELAFPKQCLWYVVSLSTICVRAACNNWTGLHSTNTHTFTHTHPQREANSTIKEPNTLSQSKRRCTKCYRYSCAVTKATRAKLSKIYKWTVLICHVSSKSKTCIICFNLSFSGKPTDICFFPFSTPV